ncbi:VasL domain-containing protein [Lonsdalea quercina]|uniref:VasL domain-containing protein n=1 Tax=Lonsdalea quercina TaxID=71657 RepID=UPI00397675C5
MQSTEPRYIRTGGDPRSFPDFTALRDELSKLTHPARPDIDWRQVEKCCLSLFEHNGVELQTAAGYTLARTHMAGLPGLNEGLSILEALVTRQWGNLWPRPVHARIDILAGLSQRLQQFGRTQTWGYTDLGALYQAEKHLTAITEALQRLELKHQTGTDDLRQQLHTVAVRLENNSGDTGNLTTSPVFVTPKAAVSREDTGILPSPWVYVVQPASAPRVSVAPAWGVKPWKPFVSGMLTTLLTGGLLWWGHAALTSNPQQDALMASVALPSAPLPEEALRSLQRTNPPWLKEHTEWVKQTQQQLEQLAAMPPDWPLAHGTALVRQVRVLWPDTEVADAVSRQWQQQLVASATPPDSLGGWQQGMAQLQRLTDRLNQLDGQRGKYMTVSELKSQVFTITQAFNQTVPVEEQLRQMAQQPTDQPAPAALRSQTALHLKQLLARYALLGRETDEKSR